jgi:hypothetical protein
MIKVLDRNHPVENLRTEFLAPVDWLFEQAQGMPNGWSERLRVVSPKGRFRITILHGLILRAITPSVWCQVVFEANGGTLIDERIEDARSGRVFGSFTSKDQLSYASLRYIVNGKWMLAMMIQSPLQKSEHLSIDRILKSFLPTVVDDAPVEPSIDEIVRIGQVEFQFSRLSTWSIDRTWTDKGSFSVVLTNRVDDDNSPLAIRFRFVEAFSKNKAPLGLTNPILDKRRILDSWVIDAELAGPAKRNSPLWHEFGRYALDTMLNSINCTK